MKIEHLAKIRGEKPYLVDEADPESLFCVLQQIEKEIRTRTESGNRLSENHPLWEERRSVKEAYYLHPDVYASFRKTLGDALSGAIKKTAPEYQEISVAPRRPAGDDTPLRLEKHRLQ